MLRIAKSWPNYSILILLIAFIAFNAQVVNSADTILFDKTFSSQSNALLQAYNAIPDPNGIIKTLLRNIQTVAVNSPLDVGALMYLLKVTFFNI